jgi:hypothetical protein
VQIKLLLGCCMLICTWMQKFIQEQSNIQRLCFDYQNHWLYFIDFLPKLQPLFFADNDKTVHKRVSFLLLHLMVSRNANIWWGQHLLTSHLLAEACESSRIWY